MVNTVNNIRLNIVLIYNNDNKYDKNNKMILYYKCPFLKKELISNYFIFYNLCIFL